MPNANIIITIDSNSRRIDYCVIEGRKLEPGSQFSFINGEWIGKFENFPVGPDNDLDILIIAIGNPNSNSTMKVTVNEQDKGTKNLYKPFNRNGYGQFSEEIKL